MIRGQIIERGSPRQVARRFAPLNRNSLRDTVRFWWQMFLPQHFKPIAAWKYRYQKRTDAYLRRKQRVMGHQLPLVWSGEMKRMVTSGVRLSGTSKRARGILTGPKHLYAYRKATGQADKAAELTRTTQAEQKEMQDFYEDLMQVRIMNLRNAERTTV